ncbi:ABC transporter substrate-binding protein [Paracoccaceae bacterium]|nr:ABC transporter substrate-binding protein [Paracoccaceae bacterium]
MSFAYGDKIKSSQELVETMYNDLVIMSGRKISVEQRNFELEKLFEKYVDVPIIARAVLGKSWRSASSEQRKNFVSAFKKYVSNKYGRQFSKFSEFKGTKLRVLKGRDTGTKAGVLISSEFIIPGKPSIKVVWQVSDGSGKFKLVDVRVEGVSMLSQERQEFKSKLKDLKGSVDGLILSISKKSS